jgi:lauroyl/myristoyl acyltransferase
MAFNIYAHDQGAVDFVDSYDTRAEARAHIARIESDWRDHPSQYGWACPWFEISPDPPYREPYSFPDLSGHG